MGHNRDRISALLRRRPDGFDDQGTPWYVGILYQGISDHYLEKQVGIVTRAGHVGCVYPYVSSGGLHDLVGSLGPHYEYLAVPLVANGSELEMVLPDTSCFSFFDWAIGDLGVELAPWRLNRSKILALHLLRHGVSSSWFQLVRKFALLALGPGLVALEPLMLSENFSVLYEQGGDDEMRQMKQIFRFGGIKVSTDLAGMPSVLVSRSSVQRSRRLLVREAVSRGIPVMRPDTFAGRVIESLALRGW
ncbi:hypothetical protein [Micromonospora zhanjiangensis]|uniref:Uncharacterized protein n=1 Tax=Micromonospora zhanjiangensis TaxID=1522057 RepID=A0ABV8KPG4_9ACTN